MFKELADIIIDTNSKFPLYISGEIGTGKVHSSHCYIYR